jgi:predicted phosphodiesterase
MSRFYDILADWEFTICCLADLHLCGAPLSLKGEEMEDKIYFTRLLEPLQDTSILIFLGDTLDPQAIADSPKARTQEKLLYQTLDTCQLNTKTIFVMGNHDGKVSYYRWRDPLVVTWYVHFAPVPYQQVILCHGHSLATHSLKTRGIKLSDPEVHAWRAENKPLGKKIRVSPNDILIFGHLHKGYCNREEKTLAVPSIRTIHDSSQNNHLGSVGMFCFSQAHTPWDWDIKIEDPYR